MDSFEKQWLDYIDSICNKTYIEINKKTLSSSSVRCIIRHLPVIGLDDYPEEFRDKVYRIVSKCFSELWTYSQEHGFVDKSISLDTFIRNGLSFSYFENNNTIVLTQNVDNDFHKFADWIIKNNY